MCAAFAGQFTLHAENVQSAVDGEAKAQADFEAYQKIAKRLNRDQFTLYEGLPHPMFENERFKQERQREDILEIDDEWFYHTPLQFDDARFSSTLPKLLLEPERYLPYSGPKLCGGFHADYDVVLQDDQDETECHFQLCFGCHEVKMVYGDEVYLLDMKDDTAKQLRSLLEGLNKNRPTSEPDDAKAP